MFERFLSVLKTCMQPGRQRRRVLMTLVGVCVTGVGAGLIQKAAFGVDPYMCLINGLHQVIPLSFGTLFLLVNLLTLVLIFIINKHFIGLGTVINMVLLGYIVDGTVQLCAYLVPNETIVIRIVYMALGFLIVCFSSSLYFTADMGVSTYDAIALHLTAKKVGPFRFMRILTDVTCVVAGLLLSWMPGVGTIICAFGMGPLVSFFNDRISIPMLEGKR